MSNQINSSIGKLALKLILANSEELEPIYKQLNDNGFKYCVGKTGSMEMQKVVSAIETAAKRNNLVKESLYRELHALYHAIFRSDSRGYAWANTTKRCPTHSWVNFFCRSWETVLLMKTRRRMDCSCFIRYNWPSNSRT